MSCLRSLPAIESKKRTMRTCKTSFKVATSAAIFSVLAGLNAQIAQAINLNFTLYNETSKTIYYLYVSAARSNTWGSDILGAGVIASGGYENITFPNQSSSSPCIYDIRVVFNDGTKSEGRHNLCEVSSVTVR